MQIEQSTRSTNRSFKKLISANRIAPSEIYETICHQTVDLVFTAHPTQVRHAFCTGHGPRRNCLSCLSMHAQQHCTF